MKGLAGCEEAIDLGQKGGEILGNEAQSDGFPGAVEVCCQERKLGIELLRDMQLEISETGLPHPLAVATLTGCRRRVRAAPDA